jgi:anthranilate/para-aminobenzoate synthase component II
MKTILLCDHRDSFSANLIAALATEETCITVVQSQALPKDRQSLAQLIAKFDALVLSPGPGNPAQYPQSLELARQWPTTKPLLGVCLGLQIPLHAAGCCVRRICENPIHGRQESLTQLSVSRLLPDTAVPDLCVFYNSLGCSIDDGALQHSPWRVLAKSEDDVVALAEHHSAPHLLVQFHPESFATRRGTLLIDAFLRLIAG